MRAPNFFVLITLASLFVTPAVQADPPTATPFGTRARPARTSRGRRARPAVATRRGFARIGGYEDIKERLRQDFTLDAEGNRGIARYGLTPARGYLFHGPPGTSKTLFVQALAEEFGYTLLEASGSDMFSPFHNGGPDALISLLGEAEDTARKSRRPVLLFIDELDVVVPARMSDAKNPAIAATENRITAVLLNALDGTAAARLPPNVVLVGATNHMSRIDPALLRPGRFEGIIELRVPTETERRDILNVHLDSVRHDGSIDTTRLAARTRGFTGAQLAGIPRRGAVRALRNQALQLTHGDLEAGIEDEIEAMLRPDRMPEGISRVEPLSWREIAGFEDVKEDLSRLLRASQGVNRLARGITIAGPPGVGKTLFLRALATESNSRVFNISAQAVTRNPGQMVETLSSILEQVRIASASERGVVVTIDELDGLFPQRRASTNTQDDERITLVNTFLAAIDGPDAIRGVVWVGATNHPGRVDGAVTRPGRMRTYTMRAPNAADRLAVLRMHTIGAEFAPDVDLNAVSVALAELSNAEIAAVAQDARDYAGEGGVISAQHLERATSHAVAERAASQLAREAQR